MLFRELEKGIVSVMPPGGISSKLHAVHEQSYSQIEKIRKFQKLFYRRGYLENRKFNYSSHQGAALNMLRLVN